MELDYSIFVNKIKRMLETIKKEYDLTIQRYSEEKIIKESYPIKAKDSSSEKEKVYIDSILKQFFEPTLESMSLLIDNGIITWDSAIEKVNLEDIGNNSKDVKYLIYESWERLYIYKNIKYNLVMSFIMQIYLFTEKELSIFLNQKYKIQNLSTMFSCIKVIEKEGKEMHESTKSKIDMYRNIINVHKHGKGQSLNEIKKKNSHILNVCSESNDLSFVFNLKFVSFEELYDTIFDFVNQL